jgi:hypothetical protein
MSKPLKPSLKSIVAAAVSASTPPAADVTEFGRMAAKTAPSKPSGTLKERARQLSVYLEPEVYDQLREIAYTERTKIHPLMLEALDLLFRQRGARPIRELDKHS